MAIRKADEESNDSSLNCKWSDSWSKIGKFPKFMQNNEKTTVFKVLSLKNGRFLVRVFITERDYS